MKKKKSKKKTSFISKTAMTVLTIILIILFFCIMSMVEKIQGTARVVNYAGLVRGKTQRIIKLEDAGEPQDTMIADINAYIDGLQNGSSELDLVRLDDRDFQDKMTELASYFEELKAEILLVREKGEAARRAMLLYPQQMSWNWWDDVTVELRFWLPAGSFATSVVRELINTTGDYANIAE